MLQEYKLGSFTGSEDAVAHAFKDDDDDEHLFVSPIKRQTSDEAYFRCITVVLFGFGNKMPRL